ncbi:MAG TPA: ABC transporter permease subunit [Mycobacteriales bacterium]|jgi:ABC-2 type transport system permease protein|nr:ABC transporter permease subunit [Mycobacteriales bacterium]
MLLRNVFGATLWEARRSLFGWIVAMAGVTFMYSAAYRSLAKGKASVIDGYPESLRKAFNLEDFGSPAGYLGSTVFGLLLLLLVTVYVIITGTRAIAGDEESGLLDLLLAHPISRRRLLLERMAAMMAVLVAMGVVVLLVLLAIRGPGKLTVDPAKLAAMTLQWVLLGCCLGSLTLLVGAATGRRSVTIGTSVVVALTGYLADSFLPQIKGLGWIRHLSPYHWYTGGEPLRNGLQLGGCGLLIGVTVLALAAAVVLLDRRDINV